MLVLCKIDDFEPCCLPAPEHILELSRARVQGGKRAILLGIKVLQLPPKVDWN